MKNLKSAKEIHQDRMKLWDASIANHKEFIDCETNLVAKKFTEERKCPVCMSENHLKIFDKEGGTYVKCCDCSMVFINPVLKDEYLNKYYSNNHTLQSEIVNDDLSFYNKIYSKGLELVSKCGITSGKILDFGCSSGSFLNLAKQRGFQTYGIELNKHEAEYARKNGHKIFCEDLFSIDFTCKFDVITLYDVFEHIKSGDVFLRKFKSLLTPNGCILLQIPSSTSLAAKIMREKCNMFDGLEHVNLYNPDTIKLLAKNNALSVLHLQTVISEINVLNNYLSYEDPYNGSANNSNHILDLLDENKILDTLQGYKMQMALK